MLNSLIFKNFYPKWLTNEDTSNQNQQKSNNMQELLQVLVSLSRKDTFFSFFYRKLVCKI